MAFPLRALALVAFSFIAPLATAQLPLEEVQADPVLPSATSPATAALSFDPPQAAVSDSVLVFQFGPDGATAQATVALSNVAPAGSSALAFTAFTRRPLDSSFHEDDESSVFLTQSTSQDIIGGFMSVCSPTSTTSYWRVFDLAQEPFSGDLSVASVEIGIAATPAVETTLRLYRLDGTLQFGTTTLLFETTVPLDGSEGGGKLSVPVDALIAANAQLVVEWNTPIVPDQGPYLGINPSGETRPHYRSYPGCFSTDLPPIPQPSAHRHWVLNVHGTVSESAVTIAPDEGTISAGANEELVVTVDAKAMPDGVHPYELVIITNDPDNPQLVVNLTIVVEAFSVSGADGPTATAVSMSPIYPNPFASTTRIGFTLRETGHVTLDVFDVTGRRVANLLSEQRASGTHELTWEASGLAAGVYIVRLEAGGEVRVLRALVTR